MTDDDDSEVDGDDAALLTDWLTGLPENYVIEWFTDHMWVDRPWCVSWVDVCTPEFDELVGWNWTVTIVHPEDPDESDTTIHAKTDMVIPRVDYGHGSVGINLPAWSTDRISVILCEWTEEKTGRTDLTWKWNPDCGPSKMYLAAAEALEESILNPESKVLLGVTEDGKEVFVAGRVMDMILALPEDERMKLTGETMKAFNAMGEDNL